MLHCAWDPHTQLLSLAYPTLKVLKTLEMRSCMTHRQEDERMRKKPFWVTYIKQDCRPSAFSTYHPPPKTIFHSSNQLIQLTGTFLYTWDTVLASGYIVSKTYKALGFRRGDQKQTNSVGKRHWEKDDCGQRGQGRPQHLNGEERFHSSGRERVS